MLLLTQSLIESCVVVLHWRLYAFIAFPSWRLVVNFYPCNLLNHSGVFICKCNSAETAECNLVFSLLHWLQLGDQIKFLQY